MSQSGRMMIAGLGPILLALALAACGGEAETDHAEVEIWQPEAGRPQDSINAPRVESLHFDASAAYPGKRLEARVQGQGSGPLVYRYSWRVEGQRMPAEGGTITVPNHLRRGDGIEVEVVAIDGERVSAPARARIRVGNRPPKITDLGVRVIQGESDEDLGEWVADPVGEDPDGDDLSFRYAWRVEGRGIVSERERLSRETSRRGDEIQLIVWPSDGIEEGASFESAPFRVGNSPPVIVSRPPGLDPSGRFVYSIRAKDRDGDRGLRYSLLEGPASMSVDPFSGEVTWTATADDAGEHVVVVEVDDRQGGASRQRFHVGVEVSVPAAPAP